MKLISLILMFLPTFAWALVNFQNGNYNLSFVDYLNGNFKIERIYNSLDPDGVWFGQGWSTNLAHRLEFLPSNEIALFENGVGPIKVFSVDSGATDSGAMIGNLITKMRETGNFTATSLKNLENRLKNDKVFLASSLKKYNLTAQALEGKTFTSKVYSDAIITKENDLFVLRKNGEGSWTFNAKGQLIAMGFVDGSKAEFTYDNNLKNIKGPKFHLNFEWDSNGKLQGITEAAKKISYKYAGKQLSNSVDVSGNNYAYTYNGNGQLDQMTYTDGTKLNISYHATNQKVSKVNDADKSINSYEFYETETPAQIKGVKIRNEISKLLTNVEYEYKLDPKGQKYLYRTTLKEGTSLKEVLYSSCCSQPTKITVDSVVKEMSYDDNGNLTKMTDNQGNSLLVELDPKWNKPKKVSEGKNWKEYAYDDQGLVKSITSSDGMSMQISYNKKKLIESLNVSEKNGKKMIKLTYDQMDRFETVSFNNEGKLSYSYNKKGTDIKFNGKNAAEKKLELITVLNKLIDQVQSPIPQIQ